MTLSHNLTFYYFFDFYLKVMTYLIIKPFYAIIWLLSHNIRDNQYGHVLETGKKLKLWDIKIQLWDGTLKLWHKKS